MHESLYGSQPTAFTGLSDAPVIDANIDADLAMALRISEEEQKERLEELRREEEMIEQALRLSLEETQGCQ